MEPAAPLTTTPNLPSLGSAIRVSPAVSLPSGPADAPVPEVVPEPVPEPFGDPAAASPVPEEADPFPEEADPLPEAAVPLPIPRPVAAPEPGLPDPASPVPAKRTPDLFAPVP